MPDRDGPKTRTLTAVVVALSLASAGLLLLTWVPGACSASSEHRFRPMGIAPILLLILALGTAPGVLIGLGQLFFRPRLYGALSLAVSCLPYLSFWLTTWLPLDLRGIRLAD